MTVRKERAKKRALQEDPINVTCGGCRKVIPFTEGYICLECGYNKPEEK